MTELQHFPNGKLSDLKIIMLTQGFQLNQWASRDFCTDLIFATVFLRDNIAANMFSRDRKGFKASYGLRRDSYLPQALEHFIRDVEA